MGGNVTFHILLSIHQREFIVKFLKCQKISGNPSVHLIRSYLGVKHDDLLLRGHDLLNYAHNLLNHTSLGIII